MTAPLPIVESETRDMLIQALLEAARQYPHKTTASDPTRSLTYAQLTTLAKAIRRLVLSQTQGEQVGIMLPASAGALATIMGVAWAGRHPVPLNFLLQARELAAIVTDAQINLIIATEHFKPLLDAIPVQVVYLEQAHLRRRFLWEKLRRTPEPPTVAPDDVAVTLYTSGTTGQPKGVCLSYDNVVSNCQAAIEHLRLTHDIHLLGILPPFHVFGFTMLMCLPGILGCSVTYLPRFSPQAAHRAIAAGQITTLLAIPSMYNAIAHVKHLDPAQFRQVSIAVSGGEPLPRTVYDLFYQRTGVHLVEGYGLTETSPVISCDVPWDHHVGTVGRAIPGVQTEVRDAEGHPLPTGQEGELCVRGRLVMKGYYRRPEETAAIIDPDGWFHTGDVVRMDEAGHISITGRAKDLIIVGGENVYPREIESVLEQHPAVAQCAVIGRPDSSRGEVVVAFLTLRENRTATAEELRAFCRDRLAGFKVPRDILIRTELPTGPTGKILKRQLRECL